LVYRDISILLASDIEAEAEARITGGGTVLTSDVLKVSHHGSQTSSTLGFLKRVDPELAVISVGRGNRFGHPDAEVVKRLTEQVGGAGIYRTDRNGTIELISDGRRLWVKTER
jgi:competence protein ComEC